MKHQKWFNVLIVRGFVVVKQSVSAVTYLTTLDSFNKSPPSGP